MQIKDVLIGADVEFFIRHTTTGEIVSAEPYIKGTKDNPFVFDNNNKYFATSLDNVLAEICIPPARTKEEFYNYLRKSINYVNSTLPKDYCTVAQPAHFFNEKYLQTENAQTFGCEPDFNAYTGRENAAPASSDKTLRSGGGHIHIGYADPEESTNRTIIRAMDLFLSIPLVITEPDNKRKELYGKAGCYRPKKYGVEYRTISNYYCNSRKMIYWAYEATHAAIRWLNEDNKIEGVLGDYVQKTINNNDKENALKLIDNFKLKLAA